MFQSTLKDASCHKKGEENALRVARLLADAAGDLPFIVLADENGKVPERTRHAGRVTPEMGLTEAEWQVYAAGVEQIAASVKKATGLRLVFHHHCAGFIETPAEVEKLLALTDPKLVGLCLDTGHFRFAGGDPLAFLQGNAGRVWHVHFKDCQPDTAAKSREDGWDYFRSVEKGVFCELGKGEVDFLAIKKTLEQHGYDDWIVVEQDVLPGMGKPFDSAQRNRQYLNSIGL